MNVAIEKAYQLKALGGQEVYDDLERIKKQFKDISDLKKALNKQAADVKDTEEYKKLSEQLKKVTADYKAVAKELAALKVKVEEMRAFEKTQAEADKRASASKIANARAETEAQKQETQKRVQSLTDEKIATASATRQLKEFQMEKAKARSAAPAAAPGSYNDIAAQYKAALTGYKGTVNLGDAAALKLAQDHLMSLKTQLDSFNRSLTQDKVLIGEYTSGVMNAFKKMGLGHLISDQVNTAKSSLHTLNTEFEALKHQLEQIRNTGVGSLDAIERQLVENRQAALQLEGQLNHVQQELRGMGGIGTQVTQAIGNEFKNLKQSVAQFIIGYMGFQQLIAGIHSSVRINYELSDSFADIKNRIKGTDEEVNTLVGSLKELDTRSSLRSLVDIAAIVSKKGVAKEEIAGVAKAIDDLMVALGGELGDPKEAVSSLVKLVNVYSEDKHVTAENIERIGGAIAKLSTTGVATGQFLVDFAERMAGVRGITGITIDSVLGFGAALQELGQSAEVSATATSQVIVKMFTDSAKYAAMLDEPVEKFKERMQRDVLGTMILIAEKMKGNTGELAKFFEEMVDVHMRGQRAIGVMGDVAASVDYITSRLKISKEAYNEQGITADMAAEKQHNFAASIDRLKKSWELLASSKGVQETLSAVISLLRVLMDNIGLISAALLIFNARLLLTKTQVALNVIWTRIYNVALAAQLEITLANAAGFSGLWAVMAANPMTMIIGLAAVMYATWNHFSASVTKTTEALKEKNKQMRISADVSERAIGIASDEIARLKILNQALLSNAVSYDTKAEALEELKSRYPEYLNVLDAEKVSLNQITEAYKAVEKQIRKNSELKAAQELVKEKQVDMDAAVKLRKKIEMSYLEGDYTKNGINDRQVTGFSEDEKKLLKEVEKNVRKKYGGLQSAIATPGYFSDDLIFTEQAAKPILDELSKIIDKRSKTVEEYAKKAIQTKSMGSTYNENIKKRTEIEAQIAKIQDIRDNYDEGSKQYIKHTGEIKDMLGEWYKAGGRAPETIANELTELKEDLKANKNNELVAGKLRNRRAALYSEIEKSLKLHDTHAGKKGKQPADTFTQETNNESNLTKYQALAIEMRIKREMDAQKEIFDNEHESLFNRLSAHGQYVTLQGQLMQTANDAEVKIIQDKLNKIAALEASTAKKTRQEKSLIAQKPTLLAELDSVNESIKTKQEAAARETSKTYAGIMTSSLNAIAADTERDIDTALNESYERAAQMRRKIYDGNMSPDKKQRKLGELGLDTQIDSDEAAIAANEQMQRQTEADIAMVEQEAKKNSQLLGAEIAFQEKLKKLKAEKQVLEDQLREDKFNKELAAADKEAQLYDTIKDGAINAFQQMGNAYLQMSQQQQDIQMQREQRAMDWNRRQQEAQNQSLQEKQANERAYMLAQEEMERRRLQKNKQMALAQMSIDYAVGVMKIWSAKAVAAPVAIAETAVLTGVYFAKVAMLSAQKFEHGGMVPTSGGRFGGNSHASGGTPFAFGGSMFEAEAGELAIINKKSAASNDRITVTGTPKQIASRVNSIGGGVDFAPGAKSWHGFDRGIGWQANRASVPQFIGSHYTNKSIMRGMNDGAAGNEKTAEMYTTIMANSAAIVALKDHVHMIQVGLNPDSVNSYNDMTRKAVNVGTI